ncbi:MAG: hypothetical protein NDI73_12565 [Desulfuromonadales bacterium]|nr:hypothetical protein [Desulfuromonadales bacterium]
MTRKWLASLGMILLTAALWGCGSNGGGGGSDVPPPSGGTQPAVIGSSSCAVCHSAVVTQGWSGSVHDTTAIGCEGCHGGGQFHAAAPVSVAVPNRTPGLVQCDVCHDVTVRHINGDDPATSFQTTPTNPVVEGYTKVADCLGCHAGDTPAATTWPHDPENLAINSQWANSAHAGRIASATPETGIVWGHYDWDNRTSRGSCQRCHTATGISNFLTLTGDGNPATTYAANGSGNDFSHLLNWTAATGSQQNELLYCWGCHSDVATGALRNPGAITEVYAAATAGSPTATIAYPNINQSNVCMGCHLGREIGQNVANDIDADGVRGFINSHYLTAGASIFNASGYEYATYANFGFHQEVGVGGTAGTGTAGPCVTCHMTSTTPGSHSFSVVTKDAADNITAVATTVCTNCHADMTPVVLEEKKEAFHLAMEQLRLALEARGMFFQARNPYFFVGSGATAASFTDWQSVATAIGTANPAAAPVDWRDVMGAAFNYNMLEHDPGAYAHNVDYALRLVADSVDFLNDGLVDGDANLASDMFIQGMNISSAAGFSPIHTGLTGDATVCSSCHSGAPHFAALGEAQFLTAGTSTCDTCHAAGSLTANLQVLADYADSGHADVAGTWSHEEDGSCSRCHTSSGYIADLAVPGTQYAYPVGDNRLQVLVCAACHTDLSTGARRAAPALTTSWVRNAVTAVVTYPDVGDSNLCVRCHSARRAGPNITDTATTTAHYLPIAATVFAGNELMVAIGGVPTYTGVGYEFAGQTYTGLNTHAFVGSGGRGACVACHMSGSAGHTWEPVAKDAAGNITAVNSAVECANCHANMDAAHLNTSKAAFTTKLAALDGALQARGFFIFGGTFYQDAAHTVPVTEAYYTSQATLLGFDPSDLRGAAFNLWLYSYDGGDPCGYVHNLPYAEKLIADSIDFLSNGIVGDGL